MAGLSGSHLVAGWRSHSQPFLRGGVDTVEVGEKPCCLCLLLPEMEILQSDLALLIFEKIR